MRRAKPWTALPVIGEAGLLADMSAPVILDGGARRAALIAIGDLPATSDYAIAPNAEPRTAERS